ncbi:MAG: hypothetical protein ACLRS8_01780 [Parabacteroides merdae]
MKANQVSTNEKAIIEAIQTKNTPALIQALITRMKNQLEKRRQYIPQSRSKRWKLHRRSMSFELRISSHTHSTQSAEMP